MKEQSERERGLSERSEFRSSRMFLRGVGNLKVRAWAKMVFGPFAETKGPRRAGAKPRMIQWPFSRARRRGEKMDETCKSERSFSKTILKEQMGEADLWKMACYSDSWSLVLEL